MSYKLILFSSFVLASFRVDSQVRELKVNPLKTYQTINHFTASDAWCGNFVGQYWEPAQKEQIARWLFSQNLDNTGSPEGIGLSLWRVNLGAGTLEQDSADIIPYQRRAESFLAKDGESYDWKKCAGQQYFMQKASSSGCNNFLLFSNSPPVQFTKNGRGWSSSKGSANITPEGYRLFAGYMAEVAKYFIHTKQWNITFISPVNEPQVNWTTPKQEGSPWRNSEIKKLLINLDQALSKSNLNGVKILIPESSELRWLYEDDLGKKARERFGNDGPYNQIKEFFDPGSANYVGDLKHLDHVISGHDYSSHSTNEILKTTREKVGMETQKYKLGFYPTEWCMLPGLKLPMDGFTADWKPDNYADMQVALLMGRVIYGDMVYANAAAWGYWKGMEINGDHALISLFPKDGNITSGGAIRSNKLLWALGNYSFFIRPGYTRIEVEGADNLDALVASAYTSPDKSRIVVVFVNSAFDTFPVKINFPEIFLNKVQNVSVFRTDTNTDLGNLHIDNQYTADKEFDIAPRSVTTVVLELNKD